MHFYAFGSVCRGEIDLGSDVDLLACVSNNNSNLSKDIFSIYSYSRIEELWKEGNAFSWHLHLESKMIFSSDSEDYLARLGAPSPYTKAEEDCAKFRALFIESYDSIIRSRTSSVFNISCMFVAMRNFATCHSLGNGQPIFSRRSPLLIQDSLEITDEIFDMLARARILSTRGLGKILDDREVKLIIDHAPIILDWLNNLSKGSY